MKNIHVLPTDKPSRIYLVKSNNRLGITSNDPEFTENFGSGTQNQHIYITNDDKFFKDEYVTDGIEIIKATPKLVDAQSLLGRRDWRKIILTDNEDLIKDGVQAIDDEFLEWFVKNPSCEEVDFKTFIKTYEDGYSFDKLEYKIIIPKIKQKMKKETLEEAVERYASKIWDYSSTSEKTLHANCKEAFLKGAKWQQERSYSEEEVLEILYKHTEDLLAGKKITLEEWFEQFKNK